jgi:RNA polymerase sigma-70 factor (ECF subfamily)
VTINRIQDDLHSDEQIIRRVLAGEIDLFRFIVERYRNRVFTVGMRFHRNRDDAHDFVQEVFVRAYDKLSSFRGESRFYSWLIKISYNHGINSIKGGRRDEGLVEEYIGSGDDGPERAHLRAEVRTALAGAIRGLPETYRICLDLFFFFGLTYPEIADITGFPVNTIKSHVFRAKHMLRDALRGTIAEEYDEM